MEIQENHLATLPKPSSFNRFPATADLGHNELESSDDVRDNVGSIPSLMSYIMSSGPLLAVERNNKRSVPSVINSLLFFIYHDFISTFFY